MLNCNYLASHSKVCDQIPLSRKLLPLRALLLGKTITNNGDLTPTSVKLEELSTQTQRGIAPLDFNRSFLW